MKKKYNLVLESESVEKLQGILAKGSITLSGFVNTMVEEAVDSMEKADLPEKIEDMSLGEFLEVVGKIMKGSGA
jgi:hypothetical protein